MSIYMLGIDHSKATLDVRSIFSFTKKSMNEFMDKLYQFDEVEGIVILSTCNRMEIWISAKNSLTSSLYELLCNYKHIEPAQYNSYKELFKEREDYDAVNHLFHLACGLKSQILGEDQIVTQVGAALDQSREWGYTDSVLEVLFRKAVTAAKKVKTEVVFPHGNSSVISNAINHMQQTGIVMKEKTCMVIGNGEMGKVAAKAFRDAGANVYVTVRQYHHGTVEVPMGCEPIDYAKRMDYISSCDYVVSATTSPHYTITKKTIEEYRINNKTNSKVCLIDLAVPRDIEPSIKGMSNIELLDMDDFKTQDESEVLKKAKEQAELILTQLMQEFYEWNHDHSIIPRIQFVKEESVKDINMRLTKQLKALDMDDHEKELLMRDIDRAAEKVINKMIFGLRDSLEREVFFECVKGLEQLYE